MSIAADQLDKRVIRRFLERGEIDASALQKHLEQLPDCAGKCVQASPEAEGADEDVTDETQAQASL